jgi:hypothetical protein
MSAACAARRRDPDALRAPQADAIRRPRSGTVAQFADVPDVVIANGFTGNWFERTIRAPDGAHRRRRY